MESLEYPEVYLDDKHFLMGASLKSDGSNFIDWYFRLRSVLWQNSVLYVLKELLEDKPDSIVCIEEKLFYLQRHDLFIYVESLMRSTMDPELIVRFGCSSPMDMIIRLKLMFFGQIRLMRYKY